LIIRGRCRMYRSYTGCCSTTQAEPAGAEVLGDSAYSSSELRDHRNNTGMVPVIKPRPLLPAVEGGFTLDDFNIENADLSWPHFGGVAPSQNRHKWGQIRMPFLGIAGTERTDSSENKKWGRERLAPSPIRKSNSSGSSDLAFSPAQNWTSILADRTQLDTPGP
jgi:hypothetical protein